MTKAKPNPVELNADYFFAEDDIDYTLYIKDTFLNSIESLGLRSALLIGEEVLDSDWGCSESGALKNYRSNYINDIRNKDGCRIVAALLETLRNFSPDSEDKNEEPLDINFVDLDS